MSLVVGRCCHIRVKWHLPTKPIFAGVGASAATRNRRDEGKGGSKGWHVDQSRFESGRVLLFEGLGLWVRTPCT